MSEFQEKHHGGKENYKHRQMVDNGINAMNWVIVITSYAIIGIPSISFFLFIFSDVMSDVWGKAIIAFIGALVINIVAASSINAWKKEKDRMLFETIDRINSQKT